MAKQLVGPVERHVEKAAVGIAAILLIFVIARYLVTSPNQIDVDGQSATPGEIDLQVERKANEVSQRIRSAHPAEAAFEPLYDRLLPLLDPFEAEGLSGELPPSAPFAPPVPVIDDPGAIEGQRKLVQVVPVSKPVLTHGRTLFQFDVKQVRNWVTVSAVFDRKEQARQQMKEYGAARSEVLYGPVQVQRRQQRSDGSWSDEDWTFIATLTAAEVPPGPPVPLSELDGETVVLADDYAAILRFYDRLRQPTLQIELLRPMLPPQVVGTKWEFSVVTSYADVLLQDDEVLHPELSAPSPELLDRYGLQRVEQLLEQADELSPSQRIDLQLTTAQDKLKSARTPDEVVIAFNLFREVEDDLDANPGQKSRAKRGMRDAEQKEKDLQRAIDRRGGVVEATPDQKEVARRVLLPAQQVWANDALEGSVESGATYQYRLRVLVYNVLAGEPTKFADPEDARVIFLEGPWSEPSEPVSIPPDHYFFVAGCDDRRQNAKVELYQWFDGVWVTSRHEVKVGDRVANEQRVEVPYLPDPTQVDRASVKFDAGVRVVDIDFDRSHRQRDAIRGGGVKFATSVATDCAVTVVDEQGRLFERFVSLDKDSPERREVAKAVWKKKRTE